MTGETPRVRFAAGSTVMVLGAGTPTGTVLMEALSPYVAVIGAGPGLSVTGQRSCSPESRARASGTDRRFVTDLLSAAQRDGVDLIIPTRNLELQILSAHRKEFGHHGIDVLVERPDTLETCLDKLQLMAHCAQEVRVPLTILLDGPLSPQQLLALGRPFAVEPRFPNESRVRLLITDSAQLADLPGDGSLIASQIVRGSDFAIEVMSRSDGRVIATVPQTLRSTVDGRVLPAHVVAGTDLQEFARRVAIGVGATHVISVMACRQDNGEIYLVDVVPRFVQTAAASVAAGVNLPVLAAAAALGAVLPDNLDFQEDEPRRPSAAPSIVPIEHPFGRTLDWSDKELLRVG